MKATFIKYEHSRIGFPHVKLKFHSNDAFTFEDPYVTIKGVIKPWAWSIERNPCHDWNVDAELEKFDKWVCDNFSDDESVQA